MTEIINLISSFEELPLLPTYRCTPSHWDHRFNGNVNYVGNNDDNIRVPGFSLSAGKKLLKNHLL